MAIDNEAAAKKKKFAVIGVSSILLVAAVVGAVTYGMSKESIAAGGGGAAGGGDGPQTSSKSVQAICQYTDYKDACQQSLAGAKNDSDPKDLIKLGFQTASNSIGEVIKNSSLLQQASKDPRTSQALEVCHDVLEVSIDDLTRSFDKIDAFDESKFDQYIADLKTWISGAITNQETCIEAFENTTGDTGEKMKNLLNSTREFTVNGLAMVDQISSMLQSFQITGVSSRRLLTDEEEGDQQEEAEAQIEPAIEDVQPEWGESEPGFVSNKRKLLQANFMANLKPNAVVSQDGKGQFKTIMEAVNSIPKKNNQTFVILVKAGIYKEQVEIKRKTNNVVLVGEGPTKTRVTGNLNFVDGTTTFRSATVVIQGDEFIARDIGFDNSAGAIKHQAVALRVSADKTIFFNCHIDGYQDTLYTHTYRQFYRDCVITGTIDFIFGDASAVFQNCKMVVRKPLDSQSCMVTAQGRQEPRGIGAIVLQNCTITAEPDFVPTASQKAYLGRPWKEYSRTIVMQSFIDKMIDPTGWSPWAGTYGLDTLFYGEYQNRGPGSGTAQRVTWKGIQKITPQIAQGFTPGPYIQGDEWIKPKGIPYESGMLKV